eukprot:COSAG06_NODE_46323_length_347_cov_8.375000_1_plen_45_part_10
MSCLPPTRRRSAQDSPGQPTWAMLKDRANSAAKKTLSAAKRVAEE